MYEMVNENLSGLKFYEIKEILFSLCYKPISIFEKIKVPYEENNVSKLKDIILENCRKEGYLVNFACKDSKIETFGIDIGIKNEIVRDYLIEKAYDMIVLGSKDIEKAIKLFRTQNDGSEVAERRIIGGLKAMGFSNEEANYLFTTCNLYPLSLFLDRLDKIRISIVKEEYYKITEENNYIFIGYECGKNYTTSEKEEIEPDIKEVVEEKVEMPDTYKEDEVGSKKEVQKEFSPTILVDNKDLIEKLFKLKPEIKNKAELNMVFEAAVKEVERLQKLMTYISKLEVEGIDFDELMEKEDKVVSFFKAIDML